jgi:hydrogenase maturation protein HypF
MSKSYHIHIKGCVQGVGFRPFVYQLAQKYKLYGEVSNSSDGVHIIVNAKKEDLPSFLSDLKHLSPPLSKVESISSKLINPRDFDSFKIVESKDTIFKTAIIPPDVSICEDCNKELFDPNDRRFLYPFITCTNCGVRYTIVKSLPYDRKNSSMSDFKMCKACKREYEDPNDRRYHAQPIGCFDCGSKLNLPLDEAIKVLKEGKIVALKGVGGYHLLCDATNDDAIKRLRDKKSRPFKPFAVMVADIDEAKELAHISKQEQKQLTSKRKAVVILKAKKSKLSSLVAPNITKIGIFLAYTPLHLLLLKALKLPLVATSANISKEPIAKNKDEVSRLNGIYDLLIDHNREIVNGCDDSVVTVVKNKQIIYRRARGYVPNSIKLPFKLNRKVLALGANQKSVIGIGFEDQVILSPHIGDLESLASIEYFKKHLDSLQNFYQFRADLVVCDKHPGYESSKFAKENFTNIHTVQHHYAHILSTMAQNGVKNKVLGIAFDGTGLGDDGVLWGGEFLLCDYEGYTRVAHLKEFKLIGADIAIKEPRRVALALIYELFGKDAHEKAVVKEMGFSDFELNALYLAWEKEINTVKTTSMGRLFDAVASLLQINHISNYEGDSGMMLEELYDSTITDHYPLSLEGKIIDFMPMIEEILKEKSQKKAVSKFFNTIVYMIEEISKRYKGYQLAIGGGVFQNRVLLELVLEKFPNILIPELAPPNDGGIALGQIASTLNCN